MINNLYVSTVESARIRLIVDTNRFDIRQFKRANCQNVSLNLATFSVDQSIIGRTDEAKENENRT